MLDVESWARIARYALGECSAGEAVQARAWIDQDPERQAVAEELMRLADAGPTAIWNAQAAWHRFSAPAVEGSTAASAESRRPAHRSFAIGVDHSQGPRRWLLAAGVAAALLASSAIAWHVTHSASQAVVPGPMRLVATQRGQSAEVYLSDGTHVRLGAASTFRFPTTFGRSRDVYLEGEAYFDVVHDSLSPFAVHTAVAVAHDIGTRFNVRAYPESSGAEVLVEEGAVALTPAASSAPNHPMADSVVLTRADLGHLDDGGRLTVTRQVNVDAYLGWMKGQLVFSETPLRDVLPQLRRWYGVDVELGDDGLANTRLTATLQVDSLPAALRRLSILLDARVQRRGQSVVLHSRHRRP